MTKKISKAKKVIIRVDGSPKVGLGHLMRCKVIAQALVEKGIKVIIVTKQANLNFREILKGLMQCCIVEINENLGYEDDARNIVQIAKSHNSNLIITDVSTDENVKNINQYAKFYQALAKSKLNVVVIDDLEAVDYPFKVHIIPYYGADILKYQKHNETKYLIGSKFYVFREEFYRLEGVKHLAKKVNNVLITLGGADKSNLTVELYDEIKKEFNYDVRVVIGPYFSDESVLKIQNKSIGRFNFDEIDKGIFWADIVITGIGLTRYEVMLVGTPCICVTTDNLDIYKNDQLVASSFVQHFRIRDGNYEEVIHFISTLDNNYSMRKKIVSEGQKLFDISGMGRIIEELECLNLI